MDFDEKDNKVIELLVQLKNAEGGYPVEMMALRRQNYIKQLAAMSIGVGGINTFARVRKSGWGASLPRATSTLLETALIVAIVVEVGAMAFINREKVNEFLRTLSNQPKVEEVQVSPEPALLITETSVTNTLDPTESSTPTGTPTPQLLLVTSTSTEKSNFVQPGSTPKPKDNNGNHYGQTPKPERTKQPNNNNKPTKSPKK